MSQRAWTPSAGRRSSGSRCRSCRTAGRGPTRSASRWTATCIATRSASAGPCSANRRRGSRRIGRAPELAGVYADNTSAAFTTILGAAKLTGRLPGGLTIGAIDAVTAHETGVGGVTIEPTTNYGVLRLRQDLRHGESSVGGILTAVNRDSDSFTNPYLHS